LFRSSGELRRGVDFGGLVRPDGAVGPRLKVDIVCREDSLNLDVLVAVERRGDGGAVRECDIGGSDMAYARGRGSTRGLS
jgi:hypothetical protein